MAFIPAPGVAEIRITGKVGVNNWACVLHWYQGQASPWNQSQITALAISTESHVLTSLIPLWCQGVIYQQTVAVDLSDATERMAQTLPSDHNGTQIGEPPTLAACIMISHKIGTRYRGGHPRTYLPPGSAADTQDGDVWTAGFVQTVQTNWASFKAGIVTDMGAEGLPNSQQCCPRYTYTYTDDPVHHKYIKRRAAFLGANPTTSFDVSADIRTQRRRLGK